MVLVLLVVVVAVVMPLRFDAFVDGFDRGGADELMSRLFRLLPAFFVVVSVGLVSTFRCWFDRVSFDSEMYLVLLRRIFNWLRFLFDDERTQNASNHPCDDSTSR